jgi:hypothetical protein
MPKANNRTITRVHFPEGRICCGFGESTAYLLCARQSRLCAMAWPDVARTYKENCRIWLCASRKAREIEQRFGARLP